MASILLTPQLQFLDDNGNPLSLGTVTTYEAGTTTLKTTYSSEDAGVENANPVVLDSAGRADIWLSTDSKYKIVVKDKAGATIYTVDNVSGAGGTITSLATAGANLDMNGYSIVTNSNKNLILNPHGTGVTHIYDLELQSNLKLNGNDIGVSDSDGFVDSSTSLNIFKFGSAANAVNYFKVNNSATGDPPTLSALGTDTNIDIKLLPKGTGALTVAGTTDYEDNVTDDDDIPNKAYVDAASAGLIASAAEVNTATSNSVGISPGRLKSSDSVANMWAVVSYSAGTPTLDASLNVTSITDTAVGRCTINVTDTSTSILAVSGVSQEIDHIIGSDYEGGATALVQIYDTDGAANADANFSFIAIGAET